MSNKKTTLLLAAVIAAAIPAGAQQLKVAKPSKAEIQRSWHAPALKATVTDTVYEVPYLETFDTQEQFDKYYTVINANNDDNTWSYDESGKRAQCRYNRENAGDDWLITPDIHLIAGKTYNVAYRIASTLLYTERFETKWGQGKTVAAMTNTLTPATELNSKEPIEYTGKITPTATGNYNIGIHYISDANQFWLYADSITVTMEADGTAPDSVTNANIIAGAKGALSATVNFKAPTHNIDGTALTSVSSIIVRNGTRTVGTIDNAVAGQEYSVTDDSPVNGFNTYSITPSNGGQTGREKTVRGYIGIDAPLPPQNVRINDKYTTYDITWDKVATTGANGGYVDPSAVTYNVYRVDDSGFLDGDPIETTQTDSISILYNEQSTDYGSVQTFNEFAVVAKNSIGESAQRMEHGFGHVFFVTGAPYNLPWKQSWAGGNVDNREMAWNDYTGDSEWFPTDREGSFDNDNGLLRCNTKSGDTAWYGTGKISLAGTTNPELIFRYKIEPNSGITLKVQALRPNGEKVDLTTIEAPTNANDTAWQVSKTLFKSLAGERYVEFIWEASCPATAKGGKVFVDEAEAMDVYGDDLAVSIASPKRAKKGQTVKASVTVRNNGDNPATNYTLSVTANGQSIGYETITKPLASFKDTTVVFSVPTSSADNTEQIIFKAVLTYANDINTDDNEAADTTTLSQGDVPAPKSVYAADDGTITWTRPDDGVKTVTDDFESYSVWSTDFGDWTVVDANNGVASTFAEDLPYPIQNTAFGFAIFDFSQIHPQFPLVYDCTRAHSGNQTATAVYNRDYKQQDNWLISPHLSGDEQTVSFWVNNFATYDEETSREVDMRESFDVLASSTDTETSSFTKIGDTHSTAAGVWLNVSVDLPAGSKYFAIHQITTNTSALEFSVDDVTYTAGAPTPVAYNIYCDGELIATVSASGTLSYKDEAGDGSTHEYSVTAVYDDGEESLPAKAGTATAINTVRTAGANNGNSPLFNLAGQQVGSSYKGVVIKDGKKFIRK